MFLRSPLFRTWALVSLLANAVAIATIVVLLSRPSPTTAEGRSGAIANVSSRQAVPKEPEAGERHYLDYEEWVEVLEKEARAVAESEPKRLAVLAGDSITLWFPDRLLSPDRVWLNQGISGEVSQGLFDRLSVLDETEPETVFVMIGINDLLRGIDDETVIENHRKIVRDIQQYHPETQIVIQSILPHSAEESTWEGRDRLENVPNDRIRRLNDRLEELAAAEGAIYFDLYAFFVDEEGKLPMELSTDGLHLNETGYWVWRTALLQFDRLELEARR